MTRPGDQKPARPASRRVGLKLIAVLSTVLSALVFAASHATAAGTAGPELVPPSATSGYPIPLVKPHLVPAPTSVPVASPTRVPTTARAPHPRTAAAPKVEPAAIRAVHPPASPAAAAPVRVLASTSAASIGSYGCGPALAYLAAHAAPGFRFECPGYALGHQAMTCIDVAGVCPGSHLIVIDVPCSAAYMNEASNSWVLEGLRQAPIDPYGYCH